MDPLTHTAAGFVVGQAGLNRLTPNWAWVMFFAASAPDVDGLAFVPGNIEVLDWHRHFTHAFFFAPMMALAVVVGVKYVLRRQLHFRGAWILATCGVFLHDCIDWMTLHGPRLLLPFSDRHYALKIQSFFDPVMFLLLATALVMPWLSRLVTSEIGGKPATGKWTARIFLALCLCWIATRASFRDQALTELNSRIYDGIAPIRSEVVPNVNPLNFSAMVDGGLFLKTMDLDILNYFDPEAALTYYRPQPGVESGRALQVAATGRKAQIFLAWADWPHWQVNHYEGPIRWVVLIEELETDRLRNHPRVLVRLNDKFEIIDEIYERAQIFGKL